MRIINHEDVLTEGLKALPRLDKRWGAVIKGCDRPPLRRREGGFAGLCAIIVSQQLSVASANAIWAKFTARIAPLTPHAMLAATDEDLRLAGLSRPKQRSLRALAKALVEGSLVLDTLHGATPEEVHAALTMVSGIGPWTADIYLMACIGHADAFAAGDLALQEAARHAFRLEQRPSEKELVELAEAWRPWRGVAARVLWSYYRAVKRREGMT
ncbi:MAG: DNA-3-methyladenine glycosylase 2 family protein [Hyphomicrobiales bacterium]|nr:DNA-3-methyladenine glycosylase 2 family protein [Hyphomicrobiales bacterium]